MIRSAKSDNEADCRVLLWSGLWSASSLAAPAMSVAAALFVPASRSERQQLDNSTADESLARRARCPLSRRALTVGDLVTRPRRPRRMRSWPLAVLDFAVLRCFMTPGLTVMRRGMSLRA